MKPSSRLKIIGGKFRRRLIDFPDTLSIRPTPNRVRETLFNWLMEWVPGAHCLDAFSGSGALAFEAISRGAKSVLACEKDFRFAQQIEANAQKLGIENLTLFRQDFFSLPPQDSLFDIVFLDPPFEQNLLPKALEYLVDHALLSPIHHIYVEVEKAFDLASLSPKFEVLKNQCAGQVRYGLLRAY